MNRKFLLFLLITITFFSNSIFAQKELIKKQKVQNYKYEDVGGKYDSILLGAVSISRSKKFQSQGVIICYIYTSIAFIKFNGTFYHFQWSDESQQDNDIYNIVSGEGNKYFSKLIIRYSKDTKIQKPQLGFDECIGTFELRDKKGKLFELDQVFIKIGTKY